MSLFEDMPYKIDEELTNLTIEGTSKLLATWMYTVSFAHSSTSRTGYFLKKELISPLVKMSFLKYL